MPIVEAHNIVGETYCVHPQHRDNNPNKSQWIIVIDDELSSFESSINSNWISNGTSAWGVHFVNDHIEYVGISVSRSDSLIYAKFIKDEGVNVWHGYPANHVENSQDIPDDQIIEMWLAEGVLPPAKLSKISRGKKCKL